MNETYIRAVDCSLMIFGIMMLIGLPSLFIKDIGWRKVFVFILAMGMSGFTMVLITFYAFVFFS